jgi:hypothetical protein
MTVRRVLLLVMLAALAGCALLGMAALFVPLAETIWRLAGTALNTGVACALLMPLSMLVDRPKVRLGGLCGMAVVLICWLMMMVMVWGSAWSGGDTVVWRAFAVFGQTLLVGVPVMGALLVASLRWARVAAWMFAGISACAYGLFVVGSMLPEGSSFLPMSALTGKLWSSGWLVQWIGAIVAVLLVNVGCGDRRYFRWAGVLCCVVGFVIGMAGVWAEYHDGEIPGRVMAVALIAGVAMGQINLVLMARLKPGQRFIQWGTIALVLVAGISAALAAMFVSDGNIAESILVRVAAAGVIAADCGNLALIVLSLLNRNPQRAPAAVTEFKEMAIICPSCATRQRAPLGEAVCRTCGLQIFIKVVEPRCPGCGYLLYRNQSSRCPECGLELGKAPPSGEAAAQEVSAAAAPGGS